MIDSIKKFIKTAVFAVIKPPVHQISYSQAGEDAVLSNLFKDYRKPRITYLDLGTNHPSSGNNTYKFYLRGLTGVCVEADAMLIDQIKKVRPNDNVIHAGVSIGGALMADFYIFDKPAYNTFDKVEADTRVAKGVLKLIRVDKVPLITINELIQKNFDSYPDLISIDIEGLDLDVLKTLDFEKYPVPVICVETCTYSTNHIRPKDKSILEFMGTKNYEVYADTYINTIFVNRIWFYNK
jgi:FkbM family methyltransferase